MGARRREVLFAAGEGRGVSCELCMGIGMFDAMRWHSQLAVKTIHARSGVVMQDELIACDRLCAISTHSRGSGVVRATCLRALGASRPPSLQNLSIALP